MAAKTKRSGFVSLDEEQAITKRAELKKEKLLASREKAAKPLFLDDPPKGTAWADMTDDDDDFAMPSESESELSDEESVPDESSEESSQEDTTDYQRDLPAPKAVAVKMPQLKKSEQRKQEMDDLDAILGEFGIETNNGESAVSGKKKKKGKQDQEKNDVQQSVEDQKAPAKEKENIRTARQEVQEVAKTPENSVQDSVAPPAVDTAAALAAKRKELLNKGRKKGSSTATSAALAEAKTRKKKDNKKEKKASYDR